MDYNLFWNAFGAIGATVGSFATAIAVIVAVIQYRQPYIKKARVEYSTSIPVYAEDFMPHISISITNIGVRDIKVEMFYLLCGKNKWVITNIQSSVFPFLSLPTMLKPEEKVTLHMRQDQLAFEAKRIFSENKISYNKKLYPIVQDSTGKLYKGKPFKIPKYEFDKLD